jgi:hypothetical protein
MSKSTDSNLSQSNFFSSFSTNTHGSTGECQCGAFCFDSNEQWDDDHTERLPEWLALSEAEPKKWVAIDGAVKKIDFGGKEYVVDCSCGQVQRIKNALDESAAEIAKYLNLESTRLIEKSCDIAVPGKMSLTKEFMWTGENCIEVADFLGNVDFQHKKGQLFVYTKNGTVIIEKGNSFNKSNSGEIAQVNK